MLKRVTILKVLAVACVAILPGALAAESAFVERAIGVSGSFSVGGGLGGAATFELPLDLNLPVDVSLAAKAGYAVLPGGSGPVLALGAKALIFPALFGNPPVAVGLEFRGSAGEVQPLSAGPRFQFLPLVSLDFSPLVVNLSAGLGFLGGNVGLDGGVGLRYYFDPLALDASLDFSTAGSANVLLGVRYSF